ncbi:MAG: hypothetical protein IKC03_11275 [Oscillospiraceae bacterium]|nr:hypothetical protein [Oscillospiraceae bacterium]
MRKQQRTAFQKNQMHSNYQNSLLLERMRKSKAIQYDHQKLLRRNRYTPRRNG